MAEDTDQPIECALDDIDRLKTPVSCTSELQHPSSGRNMKSYSDILSGRKITGNSR